jgi:hypothetical protein
MKNPRRWILAVFIALTALGFVLPFWPLSALGLILLSLWGRWLVALLLGLLIDVAWGAPVGALHFIYFPFAALALVVALARLYGARYFIDRTPSETL